MRIFRRELLEVSNVAASKTATITLPIGERYHKVILAHGYAGGVNAIANALANITEIRVKINDKVEWVLSGTELRDANIQHGAQYDCTGLPNTSPGITIPIYFAEPWRKDNQDGLALAIPTVWKGGAFSKFTIEVDLAAAATPTLVAYSFTDQMVPELSSPMPIFRKFQRIEAVPGGVKYTINTMTKRHWLAQLSVYPDSGNARKPSKVTLTKDSIDIHKLPYEINYAELVNNDMTPTVAGRTADIYDMVLDAQDLLSGAENLATANSLSLTIEAAAAMAGSQRIVAQLLGMPE